SPRMTTNPNKANHKKSSISLRNHNLTADESIPVRDARVHNLNNVDVDLPRNALVVFTGISGSGKSSLAFGTLFAESQRRYLDSVSPYARRLIDQVGEPDVDSIEGLPPAVRSEERRVGKESRSRRAPENYKRTCRRCTVRRG